MGGGPIYFIPKNEHELINRTFFFYEVDPKTISEVFFRDNYTARKAYISGDIPGYTFEGIPWYPVFKVVTIVSRVIPLG